MATFMFKRVLIANRGEIALRISRALRELGVEVCIVHGREDRLSLPVRFSDFAIPLYRSNPLDSYLDYEAVIQAAKDVGAEAIHPGYGFLAENASFVRRCEEEGITFIGPSAEVISLLGDKIEARKAMEAAGLPVARGSDEAVDDPEIARGLAAEIGYPVIIKAAAGGGGIGMQIGLVKDTLTVIACYEDSPSYFEGIQSGDQILMVDSTSTIGLSSSESSGASSRSPESS